jgi:uncharacterized membrane protein YiaA
MIAFFERSRTMTENSSRPTMAFVGASWSALFIGGVAYVTGLWNSTMTMNEKGYYFTILLFGLFASVSLQKSVRDRMEGVPVTNIYYGISWLAVCLSILLLTVGLWDAPMTPSEKGFYAMSYILSLFSAVAVQKNVRDIAAADRSIRADVID